MSRFDIARHNDETYDPPEPWTDWCSYACCWTCRHCGAAAGYQFHNASCIARRAHHDSGDEDRR